MAEWIHFGRRAVNAANVFHLEMCFNKEQLPDLLRYKNPYSKVTDREEYSWLGVEFPVLVIGSPMGSQTWLAGSAAVHLWIQSGGLYPPSDSIAEGQKPSASYTVSGVRRMGPTRD